MSLDELNSEVGIDFGTSESELARDKAAIRLGMTSSVESSGPFDSKEGLAQSNPTSIDFGTSESEINAQKGIVRGYLGEIKKQIPLVVNGNLEKEKFQSLVNEAKIAGVSTDLIRDTLSAHGVEVVSSEKTQ